jgi:hypothetical protein
VVLDVDDPAIALRHACSLFHGRWCRFIVRPADAVHRWIGAAWSWSFSKMSNNNTI